MNLPSPDALQVALTLSTLLVVWIGWAKYIGPRVKRWWVRVVGFFQTIAGRDPIIDKITGEEVSPEVPPLGKQLASINENMAQLIEVVRSNQNAHHRIDHVEKRVSHLEQMSDERLASKLETAALLNAVANRAIDGDIE